MEKEIYEYLNDVDDLFEYALWFYQCGNDLMVAMPNWMLNTAGNLIADFVEIEFYKRKRIEDYVGTYKNMTLTIQRMENNSYYVVVDFDLDAVEPVGLTEEGNEDPK
jgi:hypothetical protein